MQTPTTETVTDTSLLERALDEADCIHALAKRTGITRSRINRIHAGFPAKEVERRALALVIERKL